MASRKTTGWLWEGLKQVLLNEIMESINHKMEYLKYE